MSVAFGSFCADLGLPLRSAYSWCAINRERMQVIFTVWDNEIDHDNNEYEFWNDEVDNLRLAVPDRRKTKNLEEMRQTLLEALENGYQTLGVLCTPRYPLTSPRSRQSYIENELLVIQLRRTPVGISGKFQGRVDTDSIRHSGSVAQTMSHSAIDDIGTNELGNDDPEYKRRMAGSYVRDGKVRNKVIKRARGLCEYCGRPGFLKRDGTPYLETHHVISLSEQGPDKPHNVIALCANDHRQAHFGENWLTLQAELLQKLNKYRTDN